MDVKTFISEFSRVRRACTTEGATIDSRFPLRHVRKVEPRLRMILEELMLDLMYHLPSQKKLKEFEVTREMVENASLHGHDGKSG